MFCSSSDCGGSLGGAGRGEAAAARAIPARKRQRCGVGSTGWRQQRQQRQQLQGGRSGAGEQGRCAIGCTAGRETVARWRCGLAQAWPWPSLCGAARPTGWRPGPGVGRVGFIRIHPPLDTITYSWPTPPRPTPPNRRTSPTHSHGRKMATVICRSVGWSLVAWGRVGGLGLLGLGLTLRSPPGAMRPRLRPDSYPFHRFPAVSALPSSSPFASGAASASGPTESIFFSLSEITAMPPSGRVHGYGHGDRGCESRAVPAVPAVPRLPGLGPGSDGRGGRPTPCSRTTPIKEGGEVTRNSASPHPARAASASALQFQQFF